MADVERLRSEVDEATEHASAAKIGLSVATAHQVFTAMVGLFPPDRVADEAADDEAKTQPHIHQLTRVIKPTQAATQQPMQLLQAHIGDSQAKKSYAAVATGKQAASGAPHIHVP